MLLLTLLLFALGLALIIKGGDYFVDAATWIAQVSGMPPFLIGATIVSLATTLPELFVSGIAATQGKVDLAIGNGIGSVTANLGLIMGLSLVCMPSVMKRGSFAIKGILMTVAALGILLCSRTGTLLMPGVVLLVVLFVFYLVENVQQARLSREEENELSAPVSRDRATVLVNAAKFVFGAAGIVIGANLLVDNGSELALVIGVPEGVIAASMVAIGTSLPELVTTITAIAKKQANLSIGNILGANIIDLTVILPLSTLLSGQTLTVSQQSLVLDFPFCLLVCLVAIVPTLIRQRTSRLQGVVLLLIYGVYLYLLCFAGV